MKPTTYNIDFLSRIWNISKLQLETVKVASFMMVVQVTRSKQNDQTIYWSKGKKHFRLGKVYHQTSFLCTDVKLL